jgi:SAM domain (Sterile alpha motif)
MIRGAAAMQEVADWLEKLGLGQYAQRFAENDISFSVLPDLNQDLNDIGVSLGNRRQLLREIADLDNTAAAPQPTNSNPTATTVDCRQIKSPTEPTTGVKRPAKLISRFPGCYMPSLTSRAAGFGLGSA